MLSYTKLIFTNMKKTWVLVVVIIIVILAVLFWPKKQDQSAEIIDETAEVAEVIINDISIELTMMNDSEQSGMATIKRDNEKSLVSITLNGSPEDSSQPANIHVDTCQNLGDIIHQLNAVENGKSETVLDVNFDDILKLIPIAISINEAEESVACGNTSAILD